MIDVQKKLEEIKATDHAAMLYQWGKLEKQMNGKGSKDAMEAMKLSFFAGWSAGSANAISTVLRVMGDVDSSRR